MLQLPPSLRGLLIALPLMFIACSSDAEPTSSSKPAEGSGEGDAPLGTVCAVDAYIKKPLSGGGHVAVGRDPFCIAWTDTFNDETGFRVVLKYNGGEEFVYRAGVNANEVFPPPTDWPDTLPRLPDDLNSPQANGILAGLRRKDFQVTVHATTPGGEFVVGGFALTVE